MRTFRNGLLMGLTFQLAIGPVFIYIVNITLQWNISTGLAATVAVTVVDYLYIALALWWVGIFLEKEKIKNILWIISAIVLIGFGIILGLHIFQNTSSIENIIQIPSILSSFSSTFLLTITSPLTIIMWTSLFSTKAIENNYSKRELRIFGLAAGLATFLFMGTAVGIVSLVKTDIPMIVIKILNGIVSVLLIIYGSIRLIKTSKKLLNT